MISALKQLQQLYSNPDKYIIQNAKIFAITSIALKFIAFAGVCFSFISPLFLGAISLTIFTASIYIDYKFCSNLKELIITIFKKSNQSPYESGYFSGRMFVNYFRISTIPYMRGFFAGVNKEFWN
jgi:hypothetical protein